MSKKLIDEALSDAKALGIRNILALRGDPPRREEYRDAEDSEDDGGQDFNWAIDLVRYIRKTHGDYFCIGVAAYPEGHAEESHPLGQSVEHDLPYLVQKVQAGADFIQTQLFFDIEAYEHFETTLREHPSGAFNSIPIIPGLMPIQSYQMIKRTTKLSHAKIPDHLLERLDAVKGDDERVKMVGVDIVNELIDKIKDIKSKTPGPKGFHFYTLNLEKAVSFILERANLIPDPLRMRKLSSQLTNLPFLRYRSMATCVQAATPALDSPEGTLLLPQTLTIMLLSAIGQQCIPSGKRQAWRPAGVPRPSTHALTHWPYRKARVRWAVRRHGTISLTVVLVTPVHPHMVRLTDTA
ncbi:hypothetical protein NXS19_012208 [Fusarium pseudograminearum]|nr:hypothetical protein NXS19_012208 [Fusarium pseudograminearum]